LGTKSHAEKDAEVFKQRSENLQSTCEVGATPRVFSLTYALFDKTNIINHDQLKTEEWL
jgi:hypothetical protein